MPEQKLQPHMYKVGAPWALQLTRACNVLARPGSSLVCLTISTTISLQLFPYSTGRLRCVDAEIFFLNYFPINSIRRAPNKAKSGQMEGSFHNQVPPSHSTFLPYHDTGAFEET